MTIIITISSFSNYINTLINEFLKKNTCRGFFCCFYNEYVSYVCEDSFEITTIGDWTQIDNDALAP
jgi:hypothetical protein